MATSQEFTKNLNAIINNKGLVNRIISDAIEATYTKEEVKVLSEREKRAFVTYVLGQAAIAKTFSK